MTYLLKATYYKYITVNEGADLDDVLEENWDELPQDMKDDWDLSYCDWEEMN